MGIPGKFAHMAKDQQMHADPELDRLNQEVETLRLELEAMGRRLAEAEHLADRDALTPLYNRRAFMREVRRALALTRRHQTPAAVIYLDMDGFKAINDTHGHAAGDACLVTVAEHLLAAVRETDVVGRLGGDEFAILLLHADAADAKVKAATLVEAVTSQPVLFGERRITVGMTYGVREISLADSAEQAVAEADAAMYLRKPNKA